MFVKWQLIARNSMLLLGIVGTVFPYSSFADSLSAQRQRYQQIKVAWDNKQLDDVQRLLPTLKKYPLYPYLQYRHLTQDLNKLTEKQVKLFMKQYPTLPLSKVLADHFIRELANRQDWSGMIRFANKPPKTVVSRCHFYYAKWTLGSKKEAYDAIPAIWLTNRVLPQECNKLLNVWQKAGKQTVNLTLQRILLVSEIGQEGKSLVAILVKQLPTKYRKLAKEMVELHEKTSNLAIFAKTYQPTAITRKAILMAHSELVHQDLDKAKSLIPFLVTWQKMTESEQLTMEKTIAWQLMNHELSDTQAKWRDAVITTSRDIALIERRIRLILSQPNKKDLKKWLALLPIEAKNKDEWRYWQADELITQGQRDKGEQILRQLMTKRGFYPMVAAQRLKQPYPIKVVKVMGSYISFMDHLVVQRVKELIFWNLNSQAQDEWINFVISRPKLEQEILARLAFKNKWPDLSVQATIVGKMWDHLEERFPFAYSHYFQQMIKGKAISKTYAMAIARQESVWNHQAQSSVGARGLMQLMPNTAKEAAKKSSFLTYKSTHQLFDPKINIQLGTYYLDSIYKQFDHNRILSSAAYNAGASRVKSWLSNSQGQLDPIAFIESIPFSETRGYVKNVLSYDVFYSYFMGKEKKLLTDSEWKLHY